MKLLTLLFLFLFLIVLNSCEAPRMEDESIAQKKAIALRVMDAFDEGDLNALDTLLADDIVDHQLDPMFTNKTGKEGVKDLFAMYDKAMRDKESVIHSIAITGDTVMMFVTTVGTWVDTMMGIPPTNKEVKVPGVDIIRIVDGKIKEHWGFFDMQAMTQMMPSMEHQK